MLWIALYLPELSLQVAARGMGQDRAIVIKDGPANRPIVIAANEIVLSLGIQLGAPVAAAEALASGLLVVARNKDNEAHALQHLAAWALQFTPTVTLEPHRGILLEAAPSLRLQGGLRQLLEKIKTGCDRLGYRVIYGIAPTARAAWWFAIAYLSFPRKRESSVVAVKPLDSRRSLPSNDLVGGGNDNISDSTDPKILRDCLGKLQVASLGWPTQTTEL
ncbi:MAG: hypothetical protein ABIW48_06460, partial [Burkholderiales bacterium]